MDFFEDQERARRQSARLLGLFGLAVMGVVGSIYFFVIFGMRVWVREEVAVVSSGAGLQPWWSPDVLLWVALVVVVVVLLGSVYKVMTLRGGGRAIARLLGGREVLPNAREEGERRLLNVVEEMAIASGVAVPAVFVLEGERRINAFAAGFAAEDAVVAVTRGCLEGLSRDELQGVVAHEFSHILHGDMRLNIRMMGLIHGVLVIGLTGYWLLRAAGRTGRVGGRDGGKAAALLAMVGLVLLCVGYTGVFFGRLIKSAICREREFLADASAVQFTRNSEGLVNALRKIGGVSAGGRLSSGHAEQVSFMCFSLGKRGGWFRGLATHPPLHARIRRMDGTWDGSFISPSVYSDFPKSSGKRSSAGRSDGDGLGGLVFGLRGDGGLVQEKYLGADDALDLVGRMEARHVAYARQVLAMLPTGLRELAREPFGARAVLVSLLVSSKASVRALQFEALGRFEGGLLAGEVEGILSNVAVLGAEARLPLMEISLPAMRWLSADQREGFRGLVSLLIDADEEMDLFEYALHYALKHRLIDPDVPVLRKVSVYRPQVVSHEIRVVLSTVAYAGHEEGGAEAAFLKGSGAFSVWGLALSILPVEGCSLDAVDGALDGLNTTVPKVKEALMRGLALCIGFDGVVTLEEAELFRAVAEALECPVPPLFAG